MQSEAQRRPHQPVCSSTTPEDFRKNGDDVSKSSCYFFVHGLSAVPIVRTPTANL
jgi:hypothetical protein